MTPLETLKKAREHLSNPQNWNQDGDYFKDDDRSTRCCCALGAVELVTGDTSDDGLAPLVGAKAEAYVLLGAALPRGIDEIHVYNDHPDTTHPDILALFGRAIASLETTHETA
jgi:hypothetical protein